MAQVHGKSKSELLAMTKTPNEGKKGEMRWCNAEMLDAFRFSSPGF